MTQSDTATAVPALNVCFAFNLKRTTRAVAQLYDDALRPSGLRGTQFSLLARVRTAGPMTLTRLADAMVMDRTTLARNLKPLVREGLLEVRVGQDRREREVVATEKGRAVFAQALPLWRAMQQRVRERLGAELADRVLDDLGRVLAAVR